MTSDEERIGGRAEACRQECEDERTLGVLKDFSCAEAIVPAARKEWWGRARYSQAKSSNGKWRAMNESHAGRPCIRKFYELCTRKVCKALQPLFVSNVSYCTKKRVLCCPHVTFPRSSRHSFSHTTPFEQLSKKVL